MENRDELFRRLIGAGGKVFPSPESGPRGDSLGQPLSVWRRTNPANVWYEIETARDWDELIARLPGLLLRRWDVRTVPVEWLATAAGSSPEAAKVRALYVRTEWPAWVGRRGADEE